MKNRVFNVNTQSMYDTLNNPHSPLKVSVLALSWAESLSPQSLLLWMGIPHTGGNSLTRPTLVLGTAKYYALP